MLSVTDIVSALTVYDWMFGSADPGSLGIFHAPWSVVAAVAHRSTCMSISGPSPLAASPASGRSYEPKPKRPHAAITKTNAGRIPLACPSPALRRFHRVLEQARDRHRADAARHGRDCTRPLRGLRELDIADELAVGG